MQIIPTKPPIYDEAHKHFEIDDEITVYTYGDIIYNPANISIDDALYAHEETHSRQQRDHGVKEWWEWYFKNPIFRFKMEAEAFARQYDKYCEVEHDRNYQYKYLHKLASSLASPMYKVGMTTSQAMTEIKWNL